MCVRFETGIYSLLCDASFIQLTLTKGVVHVQRDWALQGIEICPMTPCLLCQ